MNGPETNKTDEQSLLKLYMDLTGVNESGARNVFMYMCLPKDRGTAEAPTGEIVLKAPANGQPENQSALA